MTGMIGRQVAVAGIGYSGIYRGEAPAIERLTVDAARAANGDAGLAPRDVDGIFEYQYGESSPVTPWLQRAIGTDDLACFTDIGATGAAGSAAVSAAIAAIASGECEVALCFRSLHQSHGNNGSFGTLEVSPPGGTMFHDEYTAPYGAFNIIPSIGMRMQRRNQLLGGKAEDYGLIALNARKWAVDNERAVMRKLLTMDDYLSARMLAAPLRLLDCDLPVSASTAAILTTAERARDLPHPVVVIDAHATATGSGDWLFGTDFMTGGLPRCAERLWNKASVTRDEINLLGLYDGFTLQTLDWIEALGFCKPGEAGDWLDGGRTINPGGRMPLNTSGGQLAQGRLHGMSYMTEIVSQLRGDAGVRQVPGAKAAAIGISYGPSASALILRAE
jgi:acetyl-CoA acetyltransferase